MVSVRAGVRRASGTMALAAAVACSSLPDIERGICGNHVVDPAEDCDGFAPAGARCASVGEPSACRFRCDQGASCPPGYGCGKDALCRIPAASFVEGPELDVGSLHHVEVRDVDGDGVGDALMLVSRPGLAQESLRVQSFSDDGEPAESSNRIVTGLTGGGLAPLVATGQLTGEMPPRQDVALSAFYGNALSILTGAADGTLAPKAYSSVPISDPSLFRAIGADVFQSYGGDELVVASVAVVDGAPKLDKTGLTALTLSLPSPQPQELVLVPEPFFKLTALLRDEIDPTRPGDELVLGFEGSTVLYVWAGPGPDGAPGVLRTVGLPAGATLANASGVFAPWRRVIFVVDLDGDGRRDLLAVVDGPQGAAEVASYGVPDGTFHSAPGLVQGGDGKAAPHDSPGCDSRLSDLVAVGDLDGDGRVDRYCYGGILWGTSPTGDGDPVLTDTTDVGFLATAFIGDTNADGRADLVGFDDVDPGNLRFFAGAGERVFNPTFVSAGGMLKSIAPADVDGDNVTDWVLVVETPAAGPGASGALAIGYGQPFGPPLEPVSPGDLGNVVGAAVLDAPRLGEPAPSDGRDDLLVLSRAAPQGGTGALLYGSQDRELVSPFVLLAGAPPGYVDGLTALAVGHFDGDADAHLDLASLGLACLRDSDMPGEEDCFGRLWLLPSTGEAHIDPSKAANTDARGRSDPALPASLAAGARIVAVDLGGDGTDELVLLGSLFAEGNLETGAVGVARVETVSDTARWTLGPLETTDEFFPSAQPICLDGEGAPMCASPPPLAADLDGDGRAEVVAWSPTGGSRGGQGTAAVVALRASGEAALDVAGRVRLALPAEIAEGALGFTLVGADADAAPEMVVYGTAGAWVCDVDLAGAKLVPLVRVTERPTIAAAAGDVNGDAVEDLVLGHPLGARLFLGEAVRP
jgi:hypothetical protein